MVLNCSAKASISSPVVTSSRWLRSPAPMRAAPSWSAWIGRDIRRARMRLPSTARMTPKRARPPVRKAEARKGSTTSAQGCSISTDQPRGATGAEAASTECPSRSLAVSGLATPVFPTRRASRT